MNVNSYWGFVRTIGKKLKFLETNEIILDRIEYIKLSDVKENQLDLQKFYIR